MEKRYCAVLFALAASLGAMSMATTSSAQGNLVKNGGFQEVDMNGAPAGWVCRLGPDTALVNQGGARWLKVGNGGNAVQRIEIRPDWKWLYIGARMKARNIVLGENPWSDVRLNCYYTKGIDGERHHTAMPILKEDTDWVTRGVVSTIPREHGVDTLVIEPTIFCGGQAGYDDIVAYPILDEATMKAFAMQSLSSQHPSLADGLGMAGGFLANRPGGLPRGWEINVPQAVSTEQVDGRGVLVMAKAPGAANINATYRLNVGFETGTLRVHAKAAGQGILAGAGPGQAAKIQVLFMDYDNAKLTEGWPCLAEVPPGDSGWQSYSLDVPIPPVWPCYLLIDIMHWGESGTYRVGDMSVEILGNP